MQFFQEQKPVQQLRPQLFAAVEILQLDICQLQSYITTALLENPVLECGEAPGVSLLGDLTGTGNASGMGEEDGSALPPADFADTGAVAYGEDLTTHLLFQAGLLNLEPALQSAVRSVIHALDSDGYLRTPLEPLGPDPALLEAALRVVQRLDPAGVGARSVSECLCLQLRAEGELGLPLRIAEQYLEQAGRHAYATIAAGEHVPLAAVQEACRRIQCLSPYPCAEFSAAAAASSIVPDVLLTEQNGAFSVTVNRAYTPELTVSSFYQSLWHESEDPEVRQYLAKKFTQAEWLIHCIAQREQTLLRCCQEILRLQTPYFRGEGPLAPMTMQDVALAVGLHVSTVSRALSGKYIQTPRSIRPLRSLFSARLASGDFSASMAQQALAALVRAEDPRMPLSDQQLAAQLAAQGIAVSRRTVAKYRQQLHIPPAGGRKP